jgi:hypothetical protein
MQKKIAAAATGGMLSSPRKQNGNPSPNESDPQRRFLMKSKTTLRLLAAAIAISLIAIGLVLKNTSISKGTLTQVFNPGPPGLIQSDKLLVIDHTQQETKLINDLEAGPPKDIKESVFKGTITITARGDDCRSLTFGKMYVIWDGKGELPVDPFAAFYPGVESSFVGHTCIPARITPFSGDSTGITGTKTDLPSWPKDGNIRFLNMRGRMFVQSDGPLLLGGSSTMSTAQGSAAVEFTAASTDPFVFRVTKNGYQYISGSGTVKLPGGKVYRFPQI